MIPPPRDGRERLVTIVTPSYNQARFIRDTIESVLNQDHPAIEYLVMDGGSTDGTVDILREYEDRLTWWSEPDRGTAHAINKGWRRARGEILHWLNSDDVLLPGAVSCAVAELERHPEAVAAYGSGIVLDVAGNVTGSWPIPRADLHDVLFVYPLLLQPSIFMRTEALSRVGPLDDRLRWNFDVDLFIRLLQHGPWARVRRQLSGARRQDESLTETGGLPRLWETFRVLRRYGVPVRARAYRIHLGVSCLMTLEHASRRAPSWVRPVARRLHESLGASELIAALHNGRHLDGWAGPRLRWRPGVRGRTLEIRGTLDTTAYPKLQGQCVTVVVDGERGARVDVPHGHFDLDVPLCRPTTPSSVIEVLASRTFVPRQLGINDDRRHLAYVLRSLRVS